MVVKRKRKTSPSRKVIKKAVKAVKGKHKHMFHYAGGEAKCTCGKFLQPDGSVTPTAIARKTTKKK